MHNVVAASAVVGPLGREGQVIRITARPFVYYALLPAAIGYAIVWAPTRGVVNVGTLIALAIGVAAVLLVRAGTRRAPSG